MSSRRARYRSPPRSPKAGLGACATGTETPYGREQPKYGYPVPASDGTLTALPSALTDPVASLRAFVHAAGVPGRLQPSESLPGVPTALEAVPMSSRRALPSVTQMITAPSSEPCAAAQKLTLHARANAAMSGRPRSRAQNTACDSRMRNRDRQSRKDTNS
jgi:hypothetical protein